MENYDSIRLNWEEKGSGEPLVLLHGNGEDTSYFVNQMDWFAARGYRVLAVDTRGHGKSLRGSAPFTFETFARDLRELLDQRGLAKVHLLGFSDGGNIAITFALAYPRYLKSLILDGANLDPSGMAPSFQRPVVWAYRAAKFKARFFSWARPKVELLNLIVNHPNIPAERLSAIAAPTLVLAGTRDIILEEHTRLIHRSIPGSLLKILPGDHFIAAKESEAFNTAVLDFLGSAGAKEES